MTMWVRLMAFLTWPVLVPRFSYAYIGGGFVSLKADPHDVDVVLETIDPYGPESFATIERFFLAGMRNILDIYGVDLRFWMRDAPSGLADYRSFFQYERNYQQESRPGSASKGVVRLDVQGPSFRDEVKRNLGWVESGSFPPAPPAQ